jgi:[ribosomal protein S5]-alanine N-acetyltransferase
MKGETEMKFILRQWKKEDAEEIAKVANNPNIAMNLRNTFPNPYTLDDAKWYVNDCISKEGKNQITRAIEVGGKAVGSIGIFIKDDVYEKSGELGYWLSEDYWRQGITSQAVQIICKEAFNSFDIIRIFAEPFDYNAGSRGVLKKAGFTYEGTMRNGVYKNGKIYSYCMYSILREEIEW